MKKLPIILSSTLLALSTIAAAQSSTQMNSAYFYIYGDTPNGINGLNRDLSAYTPNFNELNNVNQIYIKFADANSSDGFNIKSNYCLFSFVTTPISYVDCLEAQQKQNGKSTIVTGFLNSYDLPFDTGRLNSILNNSDFKTYLSNHSEISLEIEYDTNIENSYKTFINDFLAGPNGFIAKVNGQTYKENPVNVSIYLAPSVIRLLDQTTLNTLISAMNSNPKAKNYLLIPLYNGNDSITQSQLNQAMAKLQASKSQPYFKFILRVAPPQGTYSKDYSSSEVLAQKSIAIDYATSSKFLGYTLYSYNKLPSSSKSDAHPNPLSDDMIKFINNSITNN